MTPTERAACAVWRRLHGNEPDEPLYTQGGALDPDGYCVRLAEALMRGQPLPGRFRGVPTRADDPWVQAALAEIKRGET